MEAIFLAIHVVIGIALIGIVLIQRSSSDGMGLGGGGGGGSNFMSGRQTANFLTRTTAILATLFIVNSLWLGILATHKTKTSLVDQVEAVGDASKKSAAKSEKSEPKVDSDQKDKETKPAKDSKADKAKDSVKKDTPKAVPVVPVAE